MTHETFYFGENNFDFTKVVSDLFGIEKLEELHLTKKQEYNEIFKIGFDSSTEFHKQFYDKYREGWPEMIALYERFIKQFIAPHIKCDFAYQSFPTFRVHLPENVAVGEYHKDADFGHPYGEINYILPMTNSEHTASVWVESGVNKGDFKPVSIQRGNVVRFFGNSLTHGNKINKTGKTRVSMDFRILPLIYYNENNWSESITRKSKFVIGEYYKLFKQGN